MFLFFWKYEKKIFLRLDFMNKTTQELTQTNAADLQTQEILPSNVIVNGITKLTLFASGAGSNAQQIINYFRGNDSVKIVLVVCNNPRAGVLGIAAEEKIPVLLLEKNRFLETGYVPEIKSYQTDLIILAGFLWKVPPVLINAFQNKIINIHPALLPAYGGKGMYGSAVHAAVIGAKEKESGITIHFVDEKYDHGEIIFQAKCAVSENETVESLAQKIHTLEHDNFPKVIAGVIERSQS
jgi:phosphoribosylglycinamide formyltransferase-1